MKLSKLLLIVILIFCTTTFGQTAEKETPQKFTYGVTVIYFYQDGRSEQKVIECPLKDDDCLLLNGTEDLNTIFNLVDKMLKNILPENERGKSFGVFTPQSGGSVRRYDVYEHVSISTMVARHPKFHLVDIVIKWQETEFIPKVKQ